jgi:enediyne biosynthesis protein E4
LKSGIGSWLEVRRGSIVTRREITSGGGHASGQNGWWHMGLGDAANAEVRVIWPDGTSSDWQSVASNGFYLAEPGKALKAWTSK